MIKSKEERIKELEKLIYNRFIELKKELLQATEKEDIQKILIRRRDEEIQNNLKWFLRYEDYVINKINKPINWDNFEPELVLVDDEDTRICWEYLRSTVSSMPSTGYVGRVLKYLLQDKVSKNYIGISCIGSDLFTLGARDKLIGWTAQDKFEKGKLACGANINVCVSLQPYGQILTGKLLAMVMCSNEVRNLWKTKYDDPLVYIVTTSLYGKSSQYNRIDNYITYIGLTKGFGNVHIDTKLYAMINEYIDLNDLNSKFENTKNPMGIPTSVKLRKCSRVESLVNQAMIKENEETEKLDAGQHHQFRGIYFGYLAKNSQDFLLDKIKEEQLEWLDRSAQTIIDFWKERWYKMRLEKLRNELIFDLDQYRIKNVLKKELNVRRQRTLFG